MSYKLRTSIPIIILDIICDKRIKKPIFLLFKNIIPTVFIINKGLGKNVSKSILFASFILIKPLSNKSFMYLEEDGKPLKKDDINTKDEIPLTLKSLANILLNKSFKNKGIPILIKRELIKKQGNKDGKIFLINKLILKITEDFKVLLFINKLINIVIIKKIVVKFFKNFFIIYISFVIIILRRFYMIQKIKQNIKDFFKSPKDVISFFLPILIALILLIPTPYTVTVGGGIINMDKKIEVLESNKSKGSFNSCYVKELNGNVLTYILGKIIPSFKLNKVEDISYDNETLDEYNFREKMYFKDSLNSAIYLSFSKLNKEISVKNNKIYVIYKDSNSRADVYVKDIILGIDGNRMSTTEELNNYLKDIDALSVTLNVLRNNKEVDVRVDLIDLSGNKKIGIYLLEDKEYETNPNISFNFSDREVGPSGGLIMTLSIYNKLTDNDITKGYKISGTGTISKNGVVGEIGGVEYKLKGAVLSKSDVFLCPYENLEEALKLKEKYNYNIKIYGVKTFDEALEVLNNL